VASGDPDGARPLLNEALELGGDAAMREAARYPALAAISTSSRK
jgi:FimV-like protein